MGQKFASIHIQTPDVASVEDVIGQVYARDPDEVENKIRLMKAMFPSVTPAMPPAFLP